MAYSAKSIANAFITLAKRDKVDINSAHLQPLMFLANVCFAAENKEEPLIYEYFEAWDCGPIVPSVYYDLIRYLSLSIRQFTRVFEPSSGRRIVVPPPDDNSAAHAVIARVWNAYGAYSSITLVRMTTRDNGPWHKARLLAAVHGMRNEHITLMSLAPDWPI